MRPAVRFGSACERAVFSDRGIFLFARLGNPTGLFQRRIFGGWPLCISPKRQPAVPELAHPDDSVGHEKCRDWRYLFWAAAFLFLQTGGPVHSAVVLFSVPQPKDRKYPRKRIHYRGTCNRRITNVTDDK